MAKTEYQKWCNDLMREIAKQGISKAVATEHMKIEPDLYKGWFDDGMPPNQAADFAANFLR